MKYYKEEYFKHYYAFDGDDSALHLNVDNSLINILTGDDWDNNVVKRTNLIEIEESEFLIYYKVITESFNQLLFNVKA